MAEEKPNPAKDPLQKEGKAAKEAQQKQENAAQAKETPKQEETAEAKLVELNDKYLRLSAEFDNYKKRTAKEKAELCAHSEARVMLRLLPVYEEIGFAEQGVAKITDKHIRDGALLVLSKLRASFEKEGLQQMKVLGEKLDPFRHEVAFREDSSAPEGTIVRAIRQGYLFKGEILQHALVSVSSGKKPEEAKKEEKETGEKGEGKKTAEKAQ